MRRRSALALVAVAALVAALLAACASSGSGGGSSGASSPTTLNVLAGSELSDMVPVLDAAKKATGVSVHLTYTGSLDGAEKVSAGNAGDAAWFASDKYIALANASTKVLDKQSTMVSPVILGVRHSAAASLGWAPPATVGWKDVASAAGAGKFHYAMTNPTASNSGFSALVGVATALAGSQALTPATIDAAGLKSFFAGQAVTSGSSGFLVDAYVGNQDHLDGMVNYESVLMGVNAGPRLHEKLDLVYPSEGIVTADYPLMLLNGAKRQAYTKLTQYLRSRDVQLRIQRDTSRRPAVPGVPLDPKFTQTLLVEAPFPANLSVVQQLLDDFQTTLRKPAHTFYVLDTSGSMQGDRLSRLKAALNGLAGSDTSFTGHFARFAPREKVTLIPFNGGVYDIRTFDIDSTDPNSPGLADLRSYINGLHAEGGTAIYSALDQAYGAAGGARQAEPDSYISIVLMTDGENNAGISANRFLDDVRALPTDLQNVRVFSVLFGEANPDALSQIADATGGKVFDARTANLADVFKEIRGYQ